MTPRRGGRRGPSRIVGIVEIIWRSRKASAHVACLIAPGCAGVELQLLEAGVITRRERYADRSTACERARELRTVFLEAGYEADEAAELDG
jgi:hypothetical protein